MGRPRKDIKKSIEDYDRRTIYLDANDPKQLEALIFLDKCTKKTGKMLGILVHEFIVSANIDLQSIQKDELADFIKNYKEIPYRAFPDDTPFPYAFYEKKLTYPVVNHHEQLINQSISTQTQEKPPIVENIENNELSEEDMADMNNALSVFGS